MCFCALMILVGITGNALVITVVKKTRSMHTTTNYLLVNLAVADIITLLWCPPVYAVTLAKIHPLGLSGSVLCKVFTGNEVVDIATTVSIINLTFLAVERYHALIKPMKHNLRLTKENLPYAISVMWALAILVSVPGFIEFRYDETKRSCVGPWSVDITVNSAVFALCVVVFFVFVPFLIVSFCYSRIIRGLFYDNSICAQACASEQDKLAKQKLAKLFVSITAGFFTCHMPFTVLMIYISFRKISDPTRVEEFALYIAFQVLSLLSLANAFINPIFYAFQSSNYRRGFKRIFRKSNTVGPLVTNDVTTDGLVQPGRSFTISHKF